ncbi:UNVERIFIED_CONTAM: hypothetical protein Sangu_1552000, partial [Sesamum angustifolium]
IMFTGALPPPRRGRREYSRGRGPLRAKRADPGPAAPSSEVVSQPLQISADSSVVGSYAAGASSSQARPDVGPPPHQCRQRLLL